MSPAAGGRGARGGRPCVRTLRSRLLRMHSAAKTCSPTLLSSSMLPPARRGARRSPRRRLRLRRAPAAAHKAPPPPAQGPPRARALPPRPAPRAGQSRAGQWARGGGAGAGRALFAASSASCGPLGSARAALRWAGLEPNRPRAPGALGAAGGPRSGGGRGGARCVSSDPGSGPRGARGRPPPDSVLQEKSHCSGLKGEVGPGRAAASCPRLRGALLRGARGSAGPPPV